MRIYCDSLYSIYTAGSVMEYLRAYILPEVPEKSADVFLHVIESLYVDPLSGIDTKQVFPHMADAEMRRCVRAWNRAGMVRRRGTGTLIINGELLLAHPDKNLEYNEDAGQLSEIVSSYREFTGTEIAFMLQWRNDTHTDKELFLQNVRRMLDASPDMGLTAILENACGNQSREEMDKSASEYALAYTLFDIFGQGQTDPADKDMQYIRKWRNEWHYTDQEIIEAAKEDFESPTFDYLNGILRNIQEAREATGVTDAREVRELSGQLKKINKLIASDNMSAENIALYARMAEKYGDAMVLLAAEECAGANRHQLVYVMRQLMKWENNGIHTEEDVARDREKKNYAKNLLSKVYAIWYGEEMLTPSIKAEDIRYAERWLKLEVPEALILHGATYAAEAENPIAYLNKIVRHYKKMGFKTVHEAIMDKQKHRDETMKAEERKKPEKILPAANYSQRSYAGEDLVANATMMEMIFESNGKSEEEARREAVEYALYKAKNDEERRAVMDLKKAWGVV